MKVVELQALRTHYAPRFLVATSDPSQPAILEQARGIWGNETTSQGLHTSFFVDGSYGAQWVIELELTPQLQRLKHLKVMHLGEYLPWQASA